MQNIYDLGLDSQLISRAILHKFHRRFASVKSHINNNVNNCPFNELVLIVHVLAITSYIAGHVPL